MKQTLCTKIIYSFLASLFIISVQTNSAYCFMGDLNTDGNLDLTDAIVGLRIVTGSSEKSNLGADVNSDLKIGMEEVVFIFQYLAGFIENPAIIDYTSLHTGEGTFYGATGQGNCSFDASPENLMVAAMNDTDYNNALVCGSFVNVFGPNGNVIVRIVDRCPECPKGDIDLSAEAFAMIAEPSMGRVQITWKYVEGDVSGSISYRFKDGSNEYWTAVQILNHRHPVGKVEMLSDDGKWVLLERASYNYFIHSSGMGPSPYTIRVTDIFGQSVTDTGISFVPGDIVEGISQFPPI